MGHTWQMRRFLVLLAVAGAAFSGVAVADVREPSEGQVVDCSRARLSSPDNGFYCSPWLNPYSR
jgi:hypothetical protein